MGIPGSGNSRELSGIPGSDFSLPGSETWENRQNPPVTVDAADAFCTMVTYEDLSANATAFAQLANWLQGGGSKCPSALDTSREVDGPGARAVLKIHSKRLNETVLNWNVVVKTLTGTEFERFLHDD